MFNMFLLSVRVDNYVVYIHRRKLSAINKYSLHKTLKYCRSIFNTKGHFVVAISTKMGGNGCLFPCLWINGHLMEALLRTWAFPTLSRFSYNTAICACHCGVMLFSYLQSPHSRILPSGLFTLTSGDDHLLLLSSSIPCDTSLSIFCFTVLYSLTHT